MHALLSKSAETALRAAGLEKLMSTNTVAHPTNFSDVVPLLAERIRPMVGSGRVTG